MERPHRFNVMLSDEEFADLGRLAARQQRTRGSVLRMLLRIGVSSCLEGKMLCGTGARCFVPHIRDAQGAHEVVGPGQTLMQYPEGSE